MKKLKGESPGSRQCFKEKEKKLGLKYEEGGYVTTAPPKCTKMATLDMSRPTSCNRVAMFGRAYIKRNRLQFLQMGQEIAARIRQFPQHLREGQNAKDFLEDVLADTCLVYAVIQVMLPTVRSDPSHYDGGASLVHSGLTLYGRRDLALLYPDGKIELCAQTPGQYYTGNLCAIRHEVRHHEPAGMELLDGHQVAIMFRTDCFRGNRASKLEGKPTPIHIYDAANEVQRKGKPLRWGQGLSKKGSLLASFKGNLFNGPLERPLFQKPLVPSMGPSLPLRGGGDGARERRILPAYVCRGHGRAADD